MPHIGVRPWLVPLVSVTIICILVSLSLLISNDAFRSARYPSFTSFAFPGSLSRNQSSSTERSLHASRSAVLRALLGEDVGEVASHAVLSHSSHLARTRHIKSTNSTSEINTTSINQSQTNHTSLSYHSQPIPSRVPYLDDPADRSCINEFLDPDTFSFWLGINHTIIQSINGSFSHFSSRNNHQFVIPSVDEVLSIIKRKAIKRFNEATFNEVMFPVRMTVFARDAVVSAQIANDTSYMNKIREKLSKLGKEWNNGDVYRWKGTPFIAEFESIDDTYETLQFDFPMLKSPLQMSKEKAGEPLFRADLLIKDITPINPQLEAELAASMLLVPSFSDPILGVDTAFPLADAIRRQQRKAKRFTARRRNILFGSVIDTRFSPLETQPPIHYDVEDGAHLCALTVVPYSRDLRRVPNDALHEPWDLHFGSDSLLVNFHSVNSSQSSNEQDPMIPRPVKKFDNDRWRHLTESDGTDPRFARMLNFKPAQQPVEMYSINFPYLPSFFRQAGWTIDQLQPFNITVEKTHDWIDVPLKLPIIVDEEYVKITIKVPVTTRVTLRIIPAVSLDLGASLYVADVRLPKLRSSLEEPLHLAFEGYHEFRNFEWNPEIHHKWLRPNVAPIKLLNSYQVVLQPSSNFIADRLPLCKGTQNRGFYASYDSPFVVRREWADLRWPDMLVDHWDQSFYPETCDYHYFTSSELMQCLNKRYQTIHWFGDSNSRRAIRNLYTGGAWTKQMLLLDETNDLRVEKIKKVAPKDGWRDVVFSTYLKSLGKDSEERDLMCEDNPDRAVAGSLGFSQVNEYPYPLSDDESHVCFFYQAVNNLDIPTHIALPKRWGDPYRCFGDSAVDHGSVISYRFLSGVSNNEAFWSKVGGDWFYVMEEDATQWDPPQLVVVGLVNWESQTSTWDWRSHRDFDSRIGEERYHLFQNTTWQLHRLGWLLYNKYVIPNPKVRIVLRNGEVWRTQLDTPIRRHTTQRLHLYSQRIHQVLLQTPIGPYLELWHVNQLQSYSAMDMTQERASSMCPNAHAMPRQIELENQLLYNMICNND